VGVPRSDSHQLAPDGGFRGMGRIDARFKAFGKGEE